MPIRIGFFGDSFVNGTGDPECLGWVGRVSQSATLRGHDVTLYNLGIRRDTSADVARRWEAEASCRLPPKHRRGLVFSFGVNDSVVEDGRPRVPPGETVANAGTILGKAMSIAPTLFVGPSPTAEDDLNQRVAALSGKLDGVCRELGVPFLDVFGPMRDSTAWKSEAERGDGTHPGAGGYGELAAFIDQWQAWRAWLA